MEAFCVFYHQNQLFNVNAFINWPPGETHKLFLLLCLLFSKEKAIMAQKSSKQPLTHFFDNKYGRTFLLKMQKVKLVHTTHGMNRDHLAVLLNREAFLFRGKDNHINITFKYSFLETPKNLSKYHKKYYKNLERPPKYLLYFCFENRHFEPLGQNFHL